MHQTPSTCPPRSRRAALRKAFAVLALIEVALQLSGCVSVPAALGDGPAAQAEQPAIEAAYGIRVEALRLTAAGSMLDLRYRVLDAEKAAPILDGKTQPYLLDAARGARLGVPDTPVLGRIRQTARNNKILTDRSYFVMFGNPGKAVHSGDKVTLLLGPLKVTELTVQ
jgi:hypothetical protein